jgi:hypothetical protein
MGMKMAEQPFMMKPRISSSLTDFEGFILLMALQTSASETGTRDNYSEERERRGRLQEPGPVAMAVKMPPPPRDGDDNDDDDDDTLNMHLGCH